MKVIGITGTSGSGKTTVCNIIEENYNIKRIDADKIAKELAQKGTEYFNEIVEYFGENILQNADENLQIDRKKLANIIFYDDIKRKKLNELTQKHVVKNINEKIEEYAKSESAIVLDVPLLFESGLDKKCDTTIGVIANESLKIKRICKRDNIDKDIAERRILALKSDEFLIQNCTNIITNNGDEEEIKEQINLILNEKIVYKNNGKIKYLQFKKLLEYPELKHAFVIKPLDFRNSDENTLKENYRNIAEALNINENDIVKPYQTHTDNIYNIGNELGIHIEELKDVDGLITDRKHVALSLVFADCMPIYLYDCKKNIIANIHSGWKGTIKKIGQKAVLQMKNNYGCNPKDIIAILGPAIRKCHFEVETDVYNLFKKEFEYMEEWELIVEELENGKYKIDTALINKIMLEETGIEEKNIIDCEICTVCNNKIMHSYRVQKEEAGRNASIMYLE